MGRIVDFYLIRFAHLDFFYFLASDYRYVCMYVYLPVAILKLSLSSSQITIKLKTELENAYAWHKQRD